MINNSKLPPPQLLPLVVVEGVQVALLIITIPFRFWISGKFGFLGFAELDHDHDIRDLVCHDGERRSNLQIYPGHLATKASMTLHIFRKY